jgi:DtxR family Mn-dependent transcriptional regulator
MPTQTKENYLKAIYFLDQKDKDISLTKLSRAMNVSAPTVNNMVKNLQEVGWVIYKKYKPLRLTEEGRRAAALIVRKHRLTEMFLTQIMGFGWEEVHDIAEDMEHIRSEKLFERMDELLGQPTVDPHGSPIPDREGKIAKQSFVELSGIGAGKTVILRSLLDSSADLLDYLNRKNIKLGTVMKILNIEPFDKSVQVSFDDQSNITLSHAVRDRLLVEVIK